MFGDVFKEISGYLDRRFLLTIWLPCLLFWAALLGLIVAFSGVAAALGWWKQQPIERQLLLALLALAWITFFAYLLSAQLNGLISLFEGYWDNLPGARTLAARRKAYHRQILRKLRDQNNSNAIYLRYPPPELPEHVMPTRLGNIMKNAEVYPLVRYEIDAVLVWPRLYSALPDRMIQEIGSARSALDLMIVISTLGAAFAAAGGLLALALLPWYAFPLCLWAGAIVAWFGYESAVRQTLPYAQLIKTAFDLHRGTLLQTIGWQVPTSYGEERRRWLQIGHLWYRGGPEGAAGAHLLGYPTEQPRKNDAKDT